MAWVVDTCVVIDVLEGDPKSGHASATLLQKLLPSGLTLCPVTMVELAAAFAGDLAEQKRFLDQAGIRHTDDWNPTDTERAHAAWAAYGAARRGSGAVKRPVADILIGAFATRFDGLVTRNPDDFRRWFPQAETPGAVSACGATNSATSFHTRGHKPLRAAEGPAPFGL